VEINYTMVIVVVVDLNYDVESSQVNDRMKEFGYETGIGMFIGLGLGMFAIVICLVLL